MRSQQVYQALAHVPNRFALCRITSMALKRLHKAYSRPEDTISNVLSEIARYKFRREHSSTNGSVAKGMEVRLVVPVEDLSLPPANATVNLELILAVELPASATSNQLAR